MTTSTRTIGTSRVGRGFIDRAHGGGRLPTRSLSVLQKSKRPLENDVVMLTPYRKEPKVWSGFVSCGYREETVSKFLAQIFYVVDFGAEFASLSQYVAPDEQFPVEERNISEPLLGFIGRPTPCPREV